MRYIIIFAYFFLILINSTFIFSQVIVKDIDFTTQYFDHRIEIQFDSSKTAPASVVAFDMISNTAVNIEEDTAFANVYVLNNVAASQILKITYRYSDSDVAKVKYLASESQSTGAITVYFNHPIDANYAQTQVAVNLADTLDDKLITYINACNNTLDIAIYNSYSASATTGIAGAINAAYARGVVVRIIYDGSTGSVMIPLLNTSIPRIASPITSTYGIMHNKFVIFDANNANANIPIVWTGSTNWTVAQIDGPDRNSVIVVQDQSLALAYKIEFEEMWGSNTAMPNIAVSKFGPYKTDNTPHTFIIGGKVVESYFSPSDGTNAKIINAINSANSDINIATMVMTPNNISSAILNKFNAGITNTNVLLDSQNPSGNEIGTLQAGLPPNQAVVYTLSGIMHHKFMVVDNFNHASDPLVTVGSHNWSASADTKNDENMLIVHDANIANQYFQAFAYLFQLAGGVLPAGLSVADYNNAGQAGLVISPNPSNGIFNIENRTGTNLENETLTVFDLLGKKVFSKNYSSFSSENIDLTREANGMYFIEMQTLGHTFHYKVIKK